MKKIAVFCSANETINPLFFEATQELGAFIAKNNFALVYGGCSMGLMECIAKAVKENGGFTIGVIPSKIEECGEISDCVDEQVMVNNLSERKDVMIEKSDIILALPGGIGTLDEIFTVAAGATIGYHEKPIILYNINGCWDKLIELMEQLQTGNFIRGNYRKYFTVVNDSEEMKKVLIDMLQPKLF